MGKELNSSSVEVHRGKGNTIDWDTHLERFGPLKAGLAVRTLEPFHVRVHHHVHV